MNKKKLASLILDRLKKEYPDAGTMLDFGSIFELLIAVVLSAQSTDEQVNRVTMELFRHYNKPADFAEMDISQLENLIRGVGLYKTKAANIKKLSARIIEEYQGKVPENFEELLTLAGVGRKTANVMLAVGFNKPGLGVDTHVHRVANRLGIISSKEAKHTELRLKELIPEDRWSDAHHLLIFHGRRVCKARKPDCSACIIEELCSKNIDKK